MLFIWSSNVIGKVSQIESTSRFVLRYRQIPRMQASFGKIRIREHFLLGLSVSTTGQASIDSSIADVLFNMVNSGIIEDPRFDGFEPIWRNHLNLIGDCIVPE
jgi:hypothetical protein